MELKVLNTKEKKRIYVRNDGGTDEFNNVTHFADSLTTHRLKLEDGALIIYPKDSIRYIKIISDNFTL